MSQTKHIYRNGRGRGVLALNSLEPCPKPIGLNTDLQKSLLNSVDSVVEVKPALPELMAKYSYKADGLQSGGFFELTIKQGEKLYLIKKSHIPTSNPHWWEVKNTQGQVGYVPAKYCLVLEEKLTSLPWLESKRLMENIDMEATSKILNEPRKIKPYVSTYQSNQIATQSSLKSTVEKQFYCEICDKTLNGPQPYKMHLASKNHREEEERLALIL
ncbi:tyrosine-protein kinase BTK isoform X2 [Hydra vulgaris]|uniref:Tyrosine-protein kinase BTK isoform X2 n=1 Tax=Hydra vulgaris TaxID=6087 RepID=A0ABM4C3R8_HYDVU